VAAGQAQEACVGKLALDAVLLEEHPLEHPRARETVGWQVRRALGEVQQNRP
jgi:hypothetical protein